MRGSSLLTFVAVAAAGVLGAWLLGLFGPSGPAVGDASGHDTLVAFAGFLLLLGSMVWFTFLLRRALPPITRAEMVGWGPVREQGRSRFVRAGVVRGFCTGLLSLAALALWNYLSGGWFKGGFNFKEFAIYPLLLLILVIGSWYSAVRVWAVNEEAHRKLIDGATPPDAQAEGRARPMPE